MIKEINTISFQVKLNFQMYKKSNIEGIEMMKG